MKKDEADELMKEFLLTAGVSRDGELRNIEAALFAEDCLGLRVTDSDISGEGLGNEDALWDFARKALGV